MALVYWKDSIDFMIIKQQRDDIGQKGPGSPSKDRYDAYRVAAEDAIKAHKQRYPEGTSA